MAMGPRSRRKTGMRRVAVSVALVVAAPLITFVAVLLVRNGLVSLGFGLDVLTLQVAQVMAFAALGFAAISMVRSLSDFRRLGLISIAVLVVTAGIVGAFRWQASVIGVRGPLDVSTDLAEPPAVPGAAGAPVTCTGAAAVPSQVAAEQATAALHAAGFAITELQLFRSRGVRDGFWFGLGHEAVIRIRPGRTDVRVVARYDRADGGETCRLANRILAGLQPAP
ncbi:hypothetical protein [Brevundimonas sp. R86498]|uniref:hypothetical protein n=1 Tax=Brevundimonas sp. R86498 TaxID=3093845 RepID=UPI0037C5AA86